MIVFKLCKFTQEKKKLLHSSLKFSACAEVKVSSPEVLGSDSTNCFALSPQDLELHHLKIAASQAAPNLHIPDQVLPLSKNKVK